MSLTERAKERNWTSTFPRQCLKVTGGWWLPLELFWEPCLGPHTLCFVLQPCLSWCLFTEDTGRAEGESGNVDEWRKGESHLCLASSFPGTAATTNYKRGGFLQQKCLLSQFWRPGV